MKSKTQTLKDIIALCPACHGVKHMRNSERIGYGETAKSHFLKINKCSPTTFARHYIEAQIRFDELNTIERWKIQADLVKFGGKDIILIERFIPRIINPYEDMKKGDKYAATQMTNEENRYAGTPKIRLIEVDNYQGTITVISDDVNKIEWLMDNELIKTKYNIVGKFTTSFSVEDLKGSSIQFRLTGDGGQTVSQPFELIGE